MEDPAGQDEPVREVWPGQGRQHGYRCAVAVTQEERRAFEDIFEKGKGVVGHAGVGDRARNVGGATVSSPVGSEHLEVLDQIREP